MMRRYLARIVLIALGGMMLPGCMPKMTMEEMRAMRPERSPELERLGMFAGTWSGDGEAEMAGQDEIFRTTGTSTSEWGCDGWCLIEHSKMEMGELGEMVGQGMWSWDGKSKKYRSTWVDNWGSTGYGTAKYNPETRTWKLKTKGYGSMGKSLGRGTVTFVDEDTMEWTWQEWDSLHLFKFMEASGTSRRQ